MKNSRQRVIAAQGTPEYSYVRFFNTVPTEPVDIYANGELKKQNLEYGIPSEYFEFKPGNLTLQGRFVDSGESTGIGIVVIPGNSTYTIAGIGMYPNKVKILQIPDAYPIDKSDPMSYLRFVNLSSDIPPVNVKLNESNLFQNVAYKEITEYRQITPGDYTLSFDSSASGIPLFGELEVSLQPGKVYTVYTIGNNTTGERRVELITDSDISAKKNTVSLDNTMFNRFQS
jgi:hypothetical protein